MSAPVVVMALWVVFGGTHVVLAAAPVRGRLVARLGEIGFVAVFYVVAVASFAALVAYYAAHRFEGPLGLGLAGVPPARWLLLGAVATGVVLASPGLLGYARLPMALFGQPIRSPRGVELITRHPFFAGTGLFAGAHALLAVHLVGTIFFGGLALLSIVGARHQDQKLLARRGPAYGEYLAATSAVPFAAVLAGRQRLPWQQVPILSLAIGVGIAVVLRTWHDVLLAADGSYVIGAFTVGSLVAGLQAWRRAQRHGVAASATRTRPLASR